MKIDFAGPKFWALTFLVLAVTACNEDFETIGSEIVSDQGLNVELNDEVTVKAYSRKLPPVQTNGLSKYQLGYYNDPVYGNTSAELVTQVVLSQTEPNFRIDPVIDSVTVYIPFFSTAISTSDGVTTYELDSVYGSSPVKIEMFENNYYLRSLDPTQGFEESQNYYSDQGELFNNFLGQSLLTLDNFTPSAEEIIEETINDDDEAEVTRLEPGIRVAYTTKEGAPAEDLQIIDYFKEKIIDNEDNEVLVSNNNFTEFFRGLNFQVTPLSDEGSLFGIDLQNANITIHYNYFINEESESRSNDTYILNFNGVIVNTFENELNSQTFDEISNSDATVGEDNIYLKGGEGSMGIIELFGDQDVLSYNENGLVSQPNGVPDELDEIRNRGWLINEANLIFYVNQDIIPGGATEPERILIYDAENARALADYNLDPTQSRTPVIEAYTNHLGPIERGEDDQGEFYKIRVTNHINNLVQRDSINRKLGLVVLQQPTAIRLQDLRFELSPNVEKIPEATVETLEGTVLYGNTTPNEEKRLKLQIFYTDPNQ